MFTCTFRVDGEKSPEEVAAEREKEAEALGMMILVPMHVLQITSSGFESVNQTVSCFLGTKLAQHLSAKKDLLPWSDVI